MTEQTNDTNPQLSLQVKQALISKALESYQRFITSLHDIPAVKFQRQQAYINFDQGILWFKEAIAAATIEIKPIENDLTQPASDSCIPTTQF